MARPEQLPYGAIDPTSQPVSTFIQPRNQALMGQPTQPAQFSSPKGLQLQGTGGTTMVQGENPFTALARSLKPFSEQLTAAAQAGGLAYAGWQMDLGEQAAMEQVAEAGARLDEEAETAELNRAAANRSVAMKDPAAGQIMNLLNPYRQIGWKRGMSKRAGKEILFGMGPYVESQADRIDYTAPDQGFAALQEIRAEYTNKILDKYGIDRGAPGFAKYTAPKIDKASEQVAQSLQTDRVNWLDAEKPKTIATLVKQEWDLIQSNNGVVVYNGQSYAPNTPGYKEALGLRLNQVAGAELMTAGLPGQSTKWAKGAFQILAADYYYNRSGDSPLNYLMSQDVKRGADGQPILDANGNPRYYTWKERFSKEDIDAEIKYGTARFTSGQQATKMLQQDFLGELVAATTGLRGPERVIAAERALANYLAKLRQQDPNMVNNALIGQLTKTMIEGLGLSSDVAVAGYDPTVAEGFLSELRNNPGGINTAQARQRQGAISASIPDPGARATFNTQADAAIRDAEVREDVENNYGTYYSPVVEGLVNEVLLREYPENTRNRRGVPGQLQSSRNRVEELYGERVRTALANEEIRLRRRLTSSEVKKITTDTIRGIKPEEMEGFWGPKSTTGKRLKQEEEKNNQQPAAQPTSGGSAPKPVPIAATYDLQGLNNIPSRRVVLRTYKTTRILDSSAIEQAVRNSTMSYDQPRSLRRAWRDAGAPSLFDFVNQQYQLLLQQVPDYEPSWTPAEWTRFKNRSLRSAGFEHSVNAFNSLNQSRPRLASIQGSMANIFIGA